MNTPKDEALGSDTRMPRPSEFYRREHPELFSDSFTDEIHTLGADELKYHLEQLTTERREREFEEFARAIAEKEICPNLLPQTGPVGGGDSKTDSSTYPVAEHLAVRRYWASEGAPAGEDWAFAFSATKAWQEKMKSDVAKIIALSRQFEKIFFITNQPVADKAREKCETKIREKFGRDVRILDRTWLVDRVFKGGHVKLAVTKLGLDVQMSPQRCLGPRDAARQAELDEVLDSLRNPDFARDDDYSLSERYLEAAKLASELERPRSEVDRLFLQARDLAAKAANPNLMLRSNYQHAWRSYFWYDDPAETARIYAAIEPLLYEVGTGEECELFSNICSLLQSARLLGQYACNAHEETARIAKLKDRLAGLAADMTRPNAALFAKTLLVGWRFKESLRQDDKLEAVLDEYLDCFRQSEGLGTYPLLKFVETIEGVGGAFCKLPNYAQFQKEVQELVGRRSGAREVGLRQLRYGIQLLTSGSNRDALVQLSKARHNLAREETLSEAGRASLALGAAYHGLHHLWAARLCYLAAAHVALYSIETMRANPRRGFFCTSRLAWIELQLGRIAPFLAWRTFSQGLLNQMRIVGEDTEYAEQDLERQDGCLGCFFIKLDRANAGEFRDLTSTLGEIGLIAGKIGLLYALGECEELEHEFSLPKAELEELIASWREQPAFAQLSGRTVGESRTNCTYETSLLGVRYRIRSKNDFGPLLNAESILGMLELVFADAKWENFAFMIDEVDLHITTDDAGGNPPELEPEKFGFEEHALTWRPGMIEWMRKNPALYVEHLRDVLTKLLLSTTIDAFEDVKSEMDAWRDDSVFERVGTAEAGFLALIDLIGADKYDLNHWINTAVAPEVQ
jgi:hypothetical protein